MAVETITYVNKSAMNTNSNINDEYKVNASDMNEIKSVVNNNANEITSTYNELMGYQEYSTNEVNTGKKWIDNKTIYRKVVETGEISSQSKTVVHNISNLGMVVSLNGICITNDSRYFTLPRVSSSDPTQQIGLLITSTNITIDAGSNANFSDSFVIIEYTKTS